jgi:hypothetical protein
LVHGIGPLHPPCPHLVPLLGPDPEEVVALTALALLEAP